MIQRKFKLCTLFALGACVLAASQQDPAQRGISEKGRERIAKEVRHELAMLPYYSVFDNLSFQVEGDTVTLLGQVVRPTLKSSARMSSRASRA